MKITSTMQALYDAVLESMRTNSAWRHVRGEERIYVKHTGLNIKIKQNGWGEGMFIVLEHSDEYIRVWGIGNRHQFYRAAQAIKKSDQNLRKLIKKKEREQELERQNTLASKTLLDFMKK